MQHLSYNERLRAQVVQAEGEKVQGLKGCLSTMHKYLMKGNEEAARLYSVMISDKTRGKIQYTNTGISNTGISI